MASDGEDFDGDYDDEYDSDPVAPLAGHESQLVRQDLRDLERFEQTFAPEGFRGVAIFCQDCIEEHYYPWEMMRENLRVLLETGDTPVHEPAFAPDPDQYVPWEYARGYADALADVGVFERRAVDACPRCRWNLEGATQQANFCPRCGAPLFPSRLRDSLVEHGLDEDEATEVLRESGIPDRGELD